MLGLTLLVASIAVADSINPSTVIPALWLASAPADSRPLGPPVAGTLASYAVGVFAVYLTGGLVLLLGPGPALISALKHIQGPLEHVIQATGGLLALALAVALWRSRRATDGERRSRRPQTRASAFALGAGIMAIELPTAFIYFGAISAILAARHAIPVEVLLVIVYNALFVAPLVALIAIRRIAGAAADRWIAGAEARLRYLGRLALTGVTGAAGATFLALGLTGLLFG
jgi:cytochrome c biogenesis protein CcdA